MSYPQSHKGGYRFRVWAPEKESITLRLLPGTEIPMHKDEWGYFFADVPGMRPGTRYGYVIDGRWYPDPCSAYQPEGVYAASEVVEHGGYAWRDNDWRGRPFAELVFYEVHVGTFTPEGTFDAMVARLDELAAMGINALELMPVAQCSGQRNWGYDGVFLYAVQNTYGGPDGLKRLVDACHQRGIAVFLDVVYNHIGKEGNCLGAFGPYFSDKYGTPWGQAMNFDGEWSDGVKEFVIANALYWAEHYHLDGLRLDAIHEMYDRNAVRIWDELYAAVKRCEQRMGRRFYLIAESDTNDVRTIRSPELGGKGFDAQWLDDFHHALYVLVHPGGWRNYRDFGGIEQLAKGYAEGYVHSGEYVFFRRRRHGASSAGIAGEHFIVFNQNHDLPGNRPDGKRLSALVELPALKLAAAALLLSPYIPMLFMGEEYGEEAPFYFFSDYQEEKTRQGLMEGRRQQFASFQFDGEPRDPQDEAVFLESKLRWGTRKEGWHGELLALHVELLRLRREHPLLADLSRGRLRADVTGEKGLTIQRWSAGRDRQLVCLFNFSDSEPLPVVRDYSGWTLLLGSAVAAGKLPPRGFAVLELRSLPPAFSAGKDSAAG
jgi:maltooligosyltrehalose trehalohydrolase